VISKGIVEQHGGDIWVESALNEGSTFSFSLPRFRADGGAPAA
jgi:signal transduction histidine kinase